MDLKIVDVREKFMKCWSHDTQKFKNLRDECGTYVFDAVMAVLLGGTGTSTLENITYISFIFNKMDVSSWKANAGLKSNKVTGTNYSQRGFFNYPNVSNKKIQLEFFPDMTIEAVCEHIKSFFCVICWRKKIPGSFRRYLRIPGSGAGKISIS